MPRICPCPAIGWYGVFPLSKYWNYAWQTCQPAASMEPQGSSPRGRLERTWGRYHGGRRPSSDDSFHSPTIIGTRQTEYHEAFPLSASDEARCDCTFLPTMVTLRDTRFVECRWWNDGRTVKTVVTWRSSASMIPAPDVRRWKRPFRVSTGNEVTHWYWLQTEPAWVLGLPHASRLHVNRLVGLVVKASASRAGGPGFESR